MGSPASSVAEICSRQCFQDGLLLTVSSRIAACVDGRAEFISKLCVALRWALSRHRDDFCRQKVQDDAVFIGGPHRAIETQERRPGRFLTAEANAAITQTIHKPFESNGNFHQDRKSGV